MKKRQQNKKNNSDVDISHSNTHRSEHDTRGIPQKVDSSNQRINDNEYGKIDD